VTRSRSERGSPDATWLSQIRSHITWLFAAAGVVAVVIVATLRHHDAGAAATQSWPPFVLVSGLLLIGLVADDDGLFATAGEHLARVARNGLVLFIGAALLVGIVTAVLNLDTSVAFLTPVLVYTAKSRGEGEAPLLYGCLLLSNAGSLFLPGSNLTNLIVLGHGHLRGTEFFHTMWLPALGALSVTAIVVALFNRDDLRRTTNDASTPHRPSFGLGLIAIIGATICVLVLAAPALPVAGIGIAAASIRIITKRERVQRAFEVLGAPILIGLFGASVALGTLGRTWGGPSRLLAHLDVWGTAGLAAISSVVMNNLPAASLLSAHSPAHPYALLIGLNLGPNAFVTGSLAWVLWLRSARSAGANPSIATAAKIGAASVPAAIAAAVGLLVLTGAT
jgi:arsenical pump membrane protein